MVDHIVQELATLLLESGGEGGYNSSCKSFQLEKALEEHFHGQPRSVLDRGYSARILIKMPTEVKKVERQMSILVYLTCIAIFTSGGKEGEPETEHTKAIQLTEHIAQEILDWGCLNRGTLRDTRSGRCPGFLWC